MSNIWTIADLHLSFGVPSKSMEVFGPAWKNYQEKMEKSWDALVAPEDLVLLPGDISWALHMEDALVDLNWIDKRPGTKVMIKGNHDYWWPSSSKLKAVMPPSIHFIYNNSFDFGEISVAGTRLWDTPEYDFSSVVEFVPNPRVKAEPQTIDEEEHIFVRELERLKNSLRCLNPKAKLRIVMTHYPPIGADLAPSRASALLEEYKVDICIFGHLHNVPPGKLNFGTARGVRYIFASADYLDFALFKIV